MKVSIICILIVASFHLWAQKSPIKFGEIDMADMKMTSYDQDTSAAAVILVDYGESHVEETIDYYTLIYKRHVRIKILKTSGTSWADVQVRLYKSSSSNDKVIGLKAATYNLENGKIVESLMTKDNVFLERSNRAYNLQKFTLPNVKPGSIIEYTFSTTSDFITSFPYWQFQKGIPVRWSEYWAITPENWVFDKYMQGYLTAQYDMKHDAYSNLTVQKQHWVMQNAPAFKPEPYMTTEGDYVAAVRFHLGGVNDPLRGYRDFSGTWKTIGKSLAEDESFGKAVSKSGFLKEKTESLISGLTDSIQKIQAIHTYIKQNIEYDGTEDYLAGNLKKVVESKKGTSGDINLILASMLDKAGFDVSMILLSTRDHGFIRQSYPSISQFNYAICQVKIGKRMMMLDATEKYLPMSILPERCLNGQGLIVSSNAAEWTDITSKARARTVVGAELVLTDQGQLKGTVTFTRNGYDAFDMREDYKQKGEKDYLKNVLGDRNWKVGKSSFSEMDDLDKPVKEIHDISIEEHASVNGGTIYINPFIEYKIENNPFKTVNREYPVDYGSPQEKLYSCKITLPDGYVVDEVPKSKLISLPNNGGRFSYNVAVLGNAINITSSILINKSLYLQQEYPSLREFYAQVIAKQDEQIVLKKK